MQINRTIYKSPIGKLLLSEADGKICGLSFNADETLVQGNSRVLLEAKMQLREYFEGTRQVFTLPLFTDVSDFSTSVLNEISKIPYGTTTTYSEIAAIIGNPGASRAVGTACHNNPIAIFIPCHRVVGVGANLVGFGGGLSAKEHLLRLEGAIF